MAKTLYELCRMHASGKLNRIEFSEQRKEFLLKLMLSGDSTQPLDVGEANEITQGRACPVTVSGSVSKGAQQNTSESEVTEKRINVTEEPSGRKAIYIIPMVLFLIVVVGLIAGLFPLERAKKEKEIADAAEIQQETTALQLQMYRMLSLEQWSPEELTHFNIMLKESDSAQRLKLERDERFIQFKETVNALQILAEAEQDKQIVTLYSELKQNLP